MLFVVAAAFRMNVVLDLDAEPKDVGLFLFFHLVYGACWAPGSAPACSGDGRQGFFGTAPEAPGVPTLATCRREIEDLHAFFVGWYTGELDRDAFERFERALAPGFEMVTSEGSQNDRTTVLDGVRGAHGRDDPGEFDVEIRNVELRADLAEHALVRYEEHQRTPDEETGRVSTALFREDESAPNGVAWLDLHETWLDD